MFVEWVLADSDPAVARPILNAAVSPRFPLSKQGSMTTAVADSPDGSRRVVTASDRTVRFHDAAGREAAVFRVESVVTDLRFSADGTRLVLSREDGLTEVWDSRDIEARNADMAARWNQREPARPWVERLLAGATPADQLEGVIADDKSRSALHRLAAMGLLKEARDGFDREARKLFDPLRSDHVTKARVRAAAERVPDPRPRVREALLNRIDDWKPDAGDLNRSAWAIVIDPASPSEKIAAALEGATEAVRLDGGKYAYYVNTLGVARYRSGDYAGALESLARAGELFVNKKQTLPPSSVAFVAMSEFRLGRVDDARASLAQLRVLVSEPMTWQGWQEDAIKVAKALFAEAEALIDPKADPPASP